MIGSVILLNKPAGVTSFEALRNVKKTLNTSKVGHTGTLDKFASGLLILLSHRYTKLAPYFVKQDKVYQASFLFGKETDTLDPEGAVVKEGPIPDLETILEGVKQFQGVIEQTPPLYSAVKIGGKQASKYARSGQSVTLKSRHITLYSFSVDEYTPPLLKVTVHCSSGTYIRSIARDLGALCNSCAHVTQLTRLAVGEFSLNESMAPEAFSGEKDTFPVFNAIERLKGVESLTVSAEQASLILKGIPLKGIVLEGSLSQGVTALFDDQQQLLAFVKREASQISYAGVFSR